MNDGTAAEAAAMVLQRRRQRRGGGGSGVNNYIVFYFRALLFFINHGWQNAAIYKGWMRGDETMSVATPSSLNNYVL